MTRRRKLLLALAVVLLLALAAGFILPALPATEYWTTGARFCGNCGLVMAVGEGGQVDGPMTSVRNELRETELSTWFESHFTLCSHNWRTLYLDTTYYTNFLGLTRWEQCHESFSGRRPPTLESLAPYRATLDSKFAENPDAARKFISESLASPNPVPPAK